VNYGCVVSATVWFTGLPSAGKSTLARALAGELETRGLRVELLDGDEVRRALWPELGFSRADRDANVRRVGELAERLTRHGVITIVALVSPYRAVRDEVRSRLEAFVEVFVECALDECVRRDPKGLYAAQRAGKVRGVTGVDDPYEAPLAPEVHLRTDQASVEECLLRVLGHLDGSGLLTGTS
jgi:adenylylsulfate kinase